MMAPEVGRAMPATLMSTAMVRYAMGLRLEMWMRLKWGTETPAKFFEHCVGISLEQVANHCSLAGIRRVSALQEASA